MLSRLLHHLKSNVARHKGLALAALRAIARTHGMMVHVDGTLIRIQCKDREIVLAGRHYPYVLDMLLDFDYYFDAVDYCVAAGIRYVDYSQPGEHTLRQSGVRFFFTSLAEPDATTRIYFERTKIQPGDVVLDLGAYCGASTYFFARAVGEQGHVFAFEPDPHNFQALCRNMTKHDCRNVTTIPRGIWSSSTTLRFQAEGNMGSRVASISNRSTHLQEVSVVSLEDAVREFGIERVNVVKMDIEGAEAMVLEHGRDFLRRFRPMLIIEPHEVDGELSTGAVCKVLDEVGYLTEVIPQVRLPLIVARPAEGRAEVPRATKGAESEANTPFPSSPA